MSASEPEPARQEPTSMISRLTLSLMALATVLWSGCCGYTSQGLFREDIRTVYVEVFDNDTFRRGLEVELTKAVVDEIKLRTPLLLAPRDRADSILSGRLVEFNESTRVKSADDEVLVARMTAKVRFRWRDRLTGVDIVPERTVEESVQIAESLEKTLSELAFRETAQRIVEEMQQPW